MRIHQPHSLAVALTTAFVALLAVQLPVRAGFADGMGPGVDANPVFIPESAKSVKVTEHLNSALPLDAWFTDDSGKSVQLREYFDNAKKPVLLQIGYFRCPMLCSLVSRGLVDSLKEVKLNAGPDYEVVFLSIDPNETPELAAQKKQSFLHNYARDGSTDGWHLLTGNKLQIDRVTEAAGVEYKFVAQAQQYSHPAVVVLATPQGTISRYLYGVKFDATTMRLSLIEASNNKIGTTIDQFVLTCFQFDGKQGKYAWVAINLMKLGGAVMIVFVGGAIFFLKRYERRHPV